MDSVIILKGNNKEVQVQVISGEITKENLRDAFLLEAEVSVALYKNGIMLASKNSIYNLGKDCNGQTYKVEWEEERRSRPQTAMSSRPGSSFDIAPESPYSEAPRSPKPMSKSIDQWMFFSYDDAGKACVVCIHPRYFVTFRHGTHMKLNVGDSLQIYKAKSDSDQMFTTTVVQIFDMRDFILLKCEEDVIEKGPPLAQPEESECFLLAGYGNMDQDLSYLTGIVHVKNFYFRGPSSVSGPFILGTGVSSPGDSGGACWGSRGLIGIRLGCTTMPTAPHHSAISDAAIFSPKNYMISSTFLDQALQDEIAREESKSSTPSPPKKKSCHIATIEGIGTGELTCV